MKHLIVLTLALTSSWASAQITVTSAIYPQIGDTLRVKNTVEITPEDTVTAAGPDQTWDYGMLDDGPVTETAIISVEDSGTEVEGSVSATGLPTGGFIYYGETEDHFGVLALNQAVPLPGLDLVFARYMEPLADYHAELMYEDDFSNSTSLVSSSIPGDIIPAEILDSLGLPFSPDSLRIEQDYVRLSFADAWGTLTTPTGTYEVLRERRENQVTNGIGLKASVLPWISIPLSTTPDITIQYIYWSTEESTPIMTQTIDDDGLVTSTTYYTVERLTSIDDDNYELISSQVYPNPSVDGTIQLDIPAEVAGDYSLSWYDAQGRMVLKEEKRLLAGGQNIQLPNTTQNVLYLVARSAEQSAVVRHRIMIGG